MKEMNQWTMNGQRRTNNQLRCGDVANGHQVARLLLCCCEEPEFSRLRRVICNVKTTLYTRRTNRGLCGGLCWPATEQPSVLRACWGEWEHCSCLVAAEWGLTQSVASRRQTAATVDNLLLLLRHPHLLKEQTHAVEAEVTRLKQQYKMS